MSQLSEWSDIIKRQGEERQAREDAECDEMERRMPDEIAKLPNRPKEELVELMLQFYGGRVNPRETALRQQFHDACKAESLRRIP